VTEEIDAASEIRAPVDLQYGGVCGVRRRVWERGRVKGQQQGYLGRLYRARRGGEGHGRMHWPLMAMAVAGGFDCINGERLMAEGD
jgi:hypothetical protein